MSGILTKVTSALSGDLVFLATLFVLIFIATMYFGKNRMVSLILSFYPAAFLYNIFPFTDRLIFMEGDIGLFLNKLIIFLVFYVSANVVISKYLTSYSEYSTTTRKIGFSLSILILILIFSYFVASFDALHNFSDTIDELFSGGDKIFWWSLAPLLILM